MIVLYSRRITAMLDRFIDFHAGDVMFILFIGGIIGGTVANDRIGRDNVLLTILSSAVLIIALPAIGFHFEQTRQSHWRNIVFSLLIWSSLVWLGAICASMYRIIFS